MEDTVLMIDRKGKVLLWEQICRGFGVLVGIPHECYYGQMSRQIAVLLHYILATENPPWNVVRETARPLKQTEYKRRLAAAEYINRVIWMFRPDLVETYRHLVARNAPIVFDPPRRNPCPWCPRDTR